MLASEVRKERISLLIKIATCSQRYLASRGPSARVVIKSRGPGIVPGY